MSSIFTSLLDKCGMECDSQQHYTQSFETLRNRIIFQIALFPKLVNCFYYTDMQSKKNESHTGHKMLWPRL